MVSRINTAMSYPHRESVKPKEIKKSEDRGFQAILDESIKELKKKGVNERGSGENF